MQKINSKIQPIKLENDELSLLDQRGLPLSKKYIKAKSYTEVIQAIKNMSVRGAPLIGIVAAYGIFLASLEYKKLEGKKLINKLKAIGEEIKNARPTAINLRWAVDLMLHEVASLDDTLEIITALKKRAIWIHEDDAQRCANIGRYGSKIISKGAGILTICNTGALATGGIGTAFGIILTAHKYDPSIKVFASETRPRQQGAKLTTFECIENGINCTLISDTACGYLMKKGFIAVVIAGADRIASNGDTANKIGTYQLAVLAKENNIPFYIAAPLSTFDLSIETGDKIPIEHRDEKEVTLINEGLICHPSTQAFNPAFDITPREYIKGIITEKGIVKGDYKKEIKELFNTSAIA